MVNEIWSKANIAFVINECVMDKPLDMAKSVRNSDKRVLDGLSLRYKPDNLVHIFLVTRISIGKLANRRIGRAKAALLREFLQ